MTIHAHLPPRTKQTPAKQAILALLWSLPPIFVHFIPTSANTHPKNPKQTAAIINPLHAWMQSAKQKHISLQIKDLSSLHLVVLSLKSAHCNNTNLSQGVTGRCRGVGLKPAVQLGFERAKEIRIFQVWPEISHPWSKTAGGVSLNVSYHSSSKNKG